MPGADDKDDQNGASSGEQPVLGEYQQKEPSAEDSPEEEAALEGSHLEESDFGDSFLNELTHTPLPFRKPVPGERIGGSDGRRYEVMKELGGGAMGLVFRARDEELQRVVALKFLLPRGRGADGLPAGMLRQEARAIAQFDHENIVRVHDVAEWSGAPWEPRVPFIVMECLEGESLATLLRREQPALRRALDILASVAAGLAHAHRRHVIHRDLKPGNVFLTEKGTVKLLDFGLAWLVAASTSQVPELATAGTPTYMAPEQWRGERQDERTDLWAAGVLFYEMLTGVLPFTAMTLEELRGQVLSPDPVPSVRARRPKIPAEVARLVADLLEKDPERRLHSAEALLERLTQLEERLGPWREEARVVAPQRRQVTLVSCRLSGLSGLTRHLDVEDLSELEAAFHRSCSEVIQQLGGSLTVLVGDEVLACFGYPVAREEDSEHAVKAGLSLVASLPDFLRKRLPHLALGWLAVKVGIHTELIVFDDTPPELRGRTPTIQGEAPRIATWLARQAEPGAVLLSHTTHTLVQRAFECEPLGRRTFEGLSGNLDVKGYQVLRERRTVFRFERALSGGALSPLVGRERELAELLGQWERARGGHGGFVLVSGEAGLGKSRLIRELLERIPSDGGFQMRCQCWSQFSSSAFQPIMEMLQHLLELDGEAPPQQNLRMLQQQLDGYGLSLEQMVLIATFLSLPIPENYVISQLSPERQKERTYDALAALLLCVARKRPVLVVVEDLHWADPSTLDLLAVMLGRMARGNVFIVLSARPEFQPTWAPRASPHRLELERLSAELTTALVKGSPGGRELPEETVAQLVAKTDGIPLFAEEMTRMVLERASAGGELAGLSLSSIPLTLHELLLARLDMLPPRQKALAQLCAVVGRSFSHALLSAITQRGEPGLGVDVKALVQAGLLQLLEGSTEPRYQFRHALIQDAAYQSLLRGTRRQHHGRIAHALMESFPDMVETQPELLAHHYTQAGEVEPAIRYWTQAGIRASLRSANQEAVSHLRHALRLLRGLPDAGQRIREELQLLVALGIPLSQLQGFRSPEVEATYTRARELFHLVDEALPQLGLSFWGPFAYYFARAEFLLAHELAELLVGLGQRQGNQELLALGYRMMAMDFFTWGRMREGLEHVERALACSEFNVEQHRELAVRHWVNPRVVALAYGSLVCAALGQTEQSRTYTHEALELARAIGHPHTLASALLYTALASQIRRDAQDTLRLAEECHGLAREHWFRLWLVWSPLLRAWALSELGRPEEALGLMRKGLEHWKQTGIHAGWPHNLGMLADIHLRLGQTREALVALDEGLAWADKTGERNYEAELHRLRGEALRLLGREEEARESFLEALRLAWRQDAHAYARRVRESLGLASPALPRPPEGPWHEV
jgi:serine/threonine protein kinase/tetratricopeptide (TPR) repeat protein/ABC-type transport system involved in cytochrome c biogenesis ATPase subunit